MTPPFRRAHFVRPNDGMLYPRRFVFLDVEANRNRSNATEGHTFRLAAAVFVDRMRKRVTAPERSVQLFGTAAELWEEVTAFARGPGRTVLVAHNLPYDLRIADGMRILPSLGWGVRQLAMRDQSCWLDLNRGRSTLLLVDSRDHLPGDVGDLAKDLGLRRAGLPADDAPTAAFAKRAADDAHIIETACLRLWDWQAANEMGAWRVTGPAQATAAYRHRFMPERALLAHDDADAIEQERRAAWTGRCEAWRHGPVPGFVFEYDFLMAYAHIARDNALPTRLLGSATGRNRIIREGWSERHAVLADCVVETTVPVVPTRHEGGIMWPVGRFRTTLWDCEIQLARTAGAQVTVTGGRVYHKAPILRDWGRWIIDALEGPNPIRDKTVRRALKHWSRWTVGRFALRYPVWEARGLMDGIDFRYLRTIDHQTREVGRRMIVRGEVFDLSGEREGHDSCPSVMSWVMAKARCHLWIAMRAAGFENVVYVDTDSLWVTRGGSENLRGAGLDRFGPPLRLKATHTHCEFWGPRQFETEERRTIAGLPRKAARVQGGAYRAEIWDGLLKTLGSPSPATVRVSDRTIRPARIDRRRDHLPKGATAAKHVELDT